MTLFVHTAPMSWLDPPPLAEKPKLTMPLPAKATVERMRRLVVKSALVGLVAGGLLSAPFLWFLRVTLGSYWVAVLLAAMIGGAAFGAYVGLRAIRAALIYGMSQNLPKV